MNKLYGIIAEDVSDVNSIAEIIHKIVNTKVRKPKYYVGKGCGPIVRKCNQWSKALFSQGCDYLIIVHDSDDNSADDIETKINHALVSSPYDKQNRVISIPIQEIEAWLLSDSTAIMKVFKLPKEPRISSNPENIDSPKEYLEEVVRKISNNYRGYNNNLDNSTLAKSTDVNKILRKCPSFKRLFDFVKFRS